MDQYQKGSGPDAGKRPGHAQESREVIACLQQPELKFSTQALKSAGVHWPSAF